MFSRINLNFRTEKSLKLNSRQQAVRGTDRHHGHLYDEPCEL